MNPSLPLGFAMMGPSFLALIALVVGVGLTAAMRRVARRSRYAGAFLLVLFVPLLQWAGQGILHGRDALDPEVIVPVLWLVGAVAGLAITGLILIALGDLFIAHADIATNSWYRRRS